MKRRLRAILLRPESVYGLGTDIRFLMYAAPIRALLLVNVVKGFGRVLEVIIDAVEINTRTGIRLGWCVLHFVVSLPAHSLFFLELRARGGVTRQHACQRGEYYAEAAEHI